MSSYCTRRGGAQDLFVYSKDPQRLDSVRYWLGWTEGESVRPLAPFKETH
jgi:hypothetical protein